ncbi:hypothetical protein Xcaj_00420 [Xanthomonas axonopodis pv. cajani]|uniref:Uncharacterized protein n=1 Tax=Xanthomonas axonopodis pv. cajani TaxID=487827 RepID=A0ABX3MBT9_9XANT|nr:hypothetical protein Xcaj_00420 [Xanthomonas axonopodis pv. cajani]
MQATRYHTSIGRIAKCGVSHAIFFNTSQQMRMTGGCKVRLPVLIRTYASVRTRRAYEILIGVIAVLDVTSIIQ